MIYLHLILPFDPTPTEKPIYLESELDAPKLARTSYTHRNHDLSRRINFRRYV